MNFTVKVDDKELRSINRMIDVLGGAVTGADIKLVMGMAMKESIQQHFYKIAGDSDHHRTSLRLGATRTGLYLKAGDRTHDPQIESKGVSVSIVQQGIAQRLFGGTIVPKNVKWLTIPAVKQAYGKRATEFKNLTFRLFSPTLAGLFAAKSDEVYFWLKKKVVQPADPTVLPKPDDILAKVLDAAKKFLTQMWAKTI